MSNTLERLRAHSIISADTGDFKEIGKYKATDVTTNPAIIYEATELPHVQPLLKRAVEYALKNSKTLEEQVKDAVAMVNVLIGVEVLKVIPGRMHSQIDARTSFNTEAIVASAVQLVNLYEEQGVSRDRVVIKIPSTWEGIQAVKILKQQYRINTNMTVHYNIIQAAAAAQAGAKVVSPFVGGIEKWNTENTAKKVYTIEEHPGVQTAKNIYYYYKKYGYDTEVLGAYFQNIGELLALAGTDYVTIPLNLLDECVNTTLRVPKIFDKNEAQNLDIEKIQLDESKFRWLMNEDQMATESIAATLRLFGEASTKMAEKMKSLLLEAQ